MPSHQNRLKFFKTLKPQWVFAARFSPSQCLFSIQCLFPLSLELSLPHLPYLTSFPCSAASAAAVAPSRQDKWRGAERDQAEYVDSTHGLPRNTSHYQGLDLAFICSQPKWLCRNPWSFWYQDFIGGSKRRKTLVHGWVRVTLTSIFSHVNSWICSWIQGWPEKCIQASGKAVDPTPTFVKVLSQSGARWGPIQPLLAWLWGPYALPWKMSFRGQPHTAAASAFCHALFAPLSPAQHAVYRLSLCL